MMHTRRLFGTLVCLGLFSLAHSAGASADTSQVLDRAEEMKRAGDESGARDLLKEALREEPDNERIVHALALAYLDADNEFWALKVLREHEEADPPACSSRALRAWILIGQANLDLAEDALAAPQCEATEEMRARFSLLQAKLALVRGDEQEAHRLLEDVHGSSRVFAEDKSHADALLLRLDPGRMPLMTWRVDLGLGWTSNGLAGSPVDPADMGQDSSSPLALLDARARLVIPAARAVRPVVEAQLRVQRLTAEAVRPLSYWQPQLRPGVLFGEAFPRLLLTYGYDAVQIEADDQYEEGPVWFSSAHRVDYELEATDWLMAFGGGGKRWYREAGRTRWEVEQGLAGGARVHPSVRVMGGASARWNRAFNDAYDSSGATLLAQVSTSLPAGLQLRVNGSLSIDDYPRSHGYFAGSKGKKRTDKQLRGKVGLWSPPWSGFQIGADYERAKRWSTAEAYAFGEHRVLVHGVWAFDTDRLGRTVIGSEGRVALPLPAAAASAAGEEERVRDLMRQDDAVNRGASCMN